MIFWVKKYKSQKPNSKRFGWLTALSQLEGQISNSNVQWPKLLRTTVAFEFGLLEFF